jgi:large repetitive protein
VKTRHLRTPYVPALELLESKIVPAGNISAYIRGDILYISGDNSANQISVVPDGTNGALITSLDGTKINRQTLEAGESVTISGNRAIRALRVDLRGGDDVMELMDFTFRRDFDVYSGTGNDQLFFNNTRVGGGRSTLSTSSGNDTVQIYSSHFERIDQDAGSGNDRVNIADSYFGHRSAFEGRSGFDVIGISNVNFGYKASVEGYERKTPNGLTFASNDTATVSTGETTIIDLAANDTTAPGSLDLSSIVITQFPVRGDIEINGDGTVTYIHDGSTGSSDSFRYTIASDTGEVSNQGVVTISITDEGIENPIAANDTANVSLGGTAIINVSANDSAVVGSLDLSSISITQQPTRGTLTVNADGTVTYLNNGQTATSDSFRYTISDDSGNVSNVATVNITLGSAGVNPIANNDTVSAALGSTSSINVASNDTATSGTLNLNSVVIVSGPSNGTATVAGNGLVTYVNNGSVATADSFTYTIRDSSGNLSNIATVNINLGSGSTNPVANNDTVTAAIGSTSNINVAANDTALTGTLNLNSVVIVSGPTNGTATVSGNGLVSYVNNGGVAATDSFTYTIRDSAGNLSNVATVNINLGTGLSPVANNDTANVVIGGTTSINVASNDISASSNLDLNSVVIVSGPTNGTASVVGNGLVLYVNNGATATSDSFTYTIKDITGNVSNVATVSITLGANGNAPTAVNDTGSVAVGGTVILTVLGNDTDPQNNINPATVSVVTQPTSGTFTVNANGTVTYVHNGTSTNPTDSFTYRVTDLTGLISNLATVTLSINGTGGGAPVANEDTANVVAGGTVTINVLSNDTDPQGNIDPSTVTLLQPPAQGTATVNANGTITYTRDPSAVIATDVFFYTVADFTGQVSNAARVAVSLIV